MPGQLFRRVKRLTAQRKMTFYDLVIDVLERSLEKPAEGFRLRDASVGIRSRPGENHQAFECSMIRILVRNYLKNFL